jgi:hypothetical protein
MKLLKKKRKKKIIVKFLFHNLYSDEIEELIYYYIFKIPVRRNLIIGKNNLDVNKLESKGYIYCENIINDQNNVLVKIPYFVLLNIFGNDELFKKINSLEIAGI